MWKKKFQQRHSLSQMSMYKKKKNTSMKKKCPCNRYCTTLNPYQNIYKQLNNLIAYLLSKTIPIKHCNSNDDSWCLLNVLQISESIVKLYYDSTGCYLLYLKKITSIPFWKKKIMSATSTEWVKGNLCTLHTKNRRIVKEEERERKKLGQWRNAHENFFFLQTLCTGDEKMLQNNKCNVCNFWWDR